MTTDYIESIESNIHILGFKKSFEAFNKLKDFFSFVDAPEVIRLLRLSIEKVYSFGDIGVFGPVTPGEVIHWHKTQHLITSVGGIRIQASHLLATIAVIKLFDAVEAKKNGCEVFAQELMVDAISFTTRFLARKRYQAERSKRSGTSEEELRDDIVTKLQGRIELFVKTHNNFSYIPMAEICDAVFGEYGLVFNDPEHDERNRKWYKKARNAAKKKLKN